MFDVKRAKEMPEVANASAKPHFVQPYNHVVVGDVKVQVPANPPPSDSDLMQIHAEALALVERHGIEYKDACNRIYNQQYQRVITADMNAKAWEDLENAVTDSLYRMKGMRDAIRKNSKTKGTKAEGSKQTRNEWSGGPITGSSWPHGMPARPAHVAARVRYPRVLPACATESARTSCL
ncbi:hypothetical protein HYPSUDRAFT_210080 [Hypholoma sublateritium FD-334 SS-4]|uniref:Uncharacterized protein n=1 Tax=Hypholoma sublateritium (strain FD-334 SS-4) TaxID=945553 RepID=A0A0D2NWA1_HYPSF|nr:hypothetical protein HYPSUDRAFT_210080 [Hypholoma sublateritium FD-334 SS-4]